MAAVLKIRNEVLECLDDLSRSDRESVLAKTEKIRLLMRQTATGVREIGRQLIQLKEIIGHGRWAEYLLRAYGWEDARMAQHFMNVAVRFGNVKSEKFTQFAPSVLYMLAAPSTPLGAIEEALEQDEPPTIQETAKIVEKHKAQVSLEEATVGLPPEKREEIRRIAAKEARRVALERGMASLERARS